MSLIHISADNFNNAVEKNEILLLDFYADWCAPCQMIAPILEEIAQENPNITVGKINVDKEPLLAQKFSVMSIPMLAVVKNKQLTNQAIGYRAKEDILKLISK